MSHSDFATCSVIWKLQLRWGEAVCPLPLQLCRITPRWILLPSPRCPALLDHIWKASSRSLQDRHPKLYRPVPRSHVQSCTDVGICRNSREGREEAGDGAQASQVRGEGWRTSAGPAAQHYLPDLAGSLTWKIRSLMNSVGSSLSDHLFLHAFYIGSVVATSLKTGCGLSQLSLLRFLSLV